MSNFAQMPGLKTVLYSPVPEYFEFLEVTPVTASSENSAASSSGMPENESNASASIMSQVNDTLKKQGDRLKEFIELMQNQTNVLTDHSETLKKHRLVICQLVKDQHKLEKKMETDVAQITKKLKMMEGRIEELRQGRNPGSDGGNGNQSNGENSSSSRQNPKVQPSPSRPKAKNEKVECDYCRKALKRSYIRRHMKLHCRVRRQQQ